MNNQQVTYETIEAELAAMGLRKAGSEPGWYVLTSFGQIWATDLPEEEE